MFVFGPLWKAHRIVLGQVKDTIKEVNKMKKLKKRNIQKKYIVLYEEYYPGTMFGLCD